jgi:hypothetical protein
MKTGVKRPGRKHLSNRQRVIALVNQLPSSTPLDEIAEKIEFIAGVEEGLRKRRAAKEFPPMKYDDWCGNGRSKARRHAEFNFPAVGFLHACLS